MPNYYVHSTGRPATEDEATVLVDGKRVMRDGFGPLMSACFFRDGMFLADAKSADEPKTADDFIRAAFYRHAGAEKPEELKAWLESTPQFKIEKIASEAAIEWTSAQAGKGLGMQFDNEHDRMIADMQAAGRQPQSTQEIRDHARSHRYDATDSDVNDARSQMIADMRFPANGVTSTAAIREHALRGRYQN